MSYKLYDENAYNFIFINFKPNQSFNKMKYFESKKEISLIWFESPDYQAILV